MLPRRVPWRWSWRWIRVFFCGLVFLAASIHTQICTTDPPVSELDALLDLYDAAGGSNWRSPWPVSTSANPCVGWTGVTCTLINNVTCHVTSLALKGEGLVGTVSPSFGNLTQLASVDLSLNLLGSPLPPELGNLGRLTSMDLHTNLFTGTFPVTLSNLGSLTSCDISNNRFTGPLPTDWSAMSNLDAHGNAFSGSLTSTLCQMTHLTFLSIFDNALTGSLPSCLGDLTSLVFLQAYANLLTGTLPASIGSARSLIHIDLSNNDLSGELPASLGYLDSLQLIELDGNVLSGQLPDSLGNATALTQLDLHKNSLYGTVPSSLSNLIKLQMLELDGNALTGAIPASLGRMPALQILYLFENVLSGSLPSAIFSAKKLRQLYAQENYLMGSLSMSTTPTTAIHTVSLYHNSLTGPLPTGLCHIAGLQTLDLHDNRFTGRLPACLSSVTGIVEIDLHANIFEGPIPTAWQHLPSLQVVSLYNNFLSGTIPATLATNLYLYELFLDQNLFTGRLPANFSCSRLVQLMVQENFLSIELSLVFDAQRFPVLSSLGVSDNTPIDTLSSVTMSPTLQYVDMTEMQLMGTLPSQWLLAESLVFLDVSSNLLTGHVPETVYTTTAVRLFLNDNLFDGSLPAISEAASVDVNRSLCSLQYISLSSNYLTGPLPQVLSQCVNLTSFSASEMYLTGSAEGLFAGSKRLQQLILANNFLSGRLDDAFSSSNASDIVLNAAYNAFTGPLPTASLSRGQWQALVLTSNCFSGTLPGDALCANTKMTEILISGLHAAGDCRQKALAVASSWHFYASYLESNAVVGTFPNCLLRDLPLLQYLTMSSNHLSGTIDDAVDPPFGLTGLDLSHNLMTGTIPPRLLTFDFQLLDLSFNRFGGTIPPFVTPYYATQYSTKLSLQVNMLSGALPQNWVDAYDINVLDGNLFRCAPHSLATTNPPVNDPLAATYACGSSTTDVSLVALFIVAAVVAAIWATVSVIAVCMAPTPLWQQPCASSAVAWWQMAKQAMRRWGQWLQTEALVVRHQVMGHEALLLCVVAMLCLSMAVYAASSLYSSAYSYLYVWVVSLSLQKGLVAGALLFLWLAAFVAAFLWLRDRDMAAWHRSPLFVTQNTKRHSLATSVLQSSSATSATAPTSDDPTTPSPSLWQRWTRAAQQPHFWVTVAALVAVVLLHTLPVFAVNVAYVYTTTIGIRRQSRFFIILAMALFKLLWNAGINTLFARRRDEMDATATGGFLDLLPPQAWLDLFGILGVFNLILAPLVTEMLVSPNCFKYAFSKIPSNSYSVSGGTCYWISYSSYNPITKVTTSYMAFPCMTEDDLEFTFNAGSPLFGGNFNLNVLSSFSNGEASTIAFQSGFAYNFQCGFSMQQAFVHVFVFRYILSILVVPSLWWALKQLQRYSFRQFGGSHRLFVLVTLMLPPLYRLVDVDDSAVTATDASVEAKPVGGADEESATKEQTAPSSTHLHDIDTLILVNRPVLRRLNGEHAAMVSAESLLARLMGDAAVALSFGILFPPLGLLALIGAASDLFTTKKMLDQLRVSCRLVGQRIHQSQGDRGIEDIYGDYVRTLLSTVGHYEQVYALVLPRIVEKTRLILQMAVFLWAFTLYDVVGRASGAVEAIWVLVLVALLPSWVAALQWVVQHTVRRMSLRCCSGRATAVVTSAERINGGEVEMQTPMQMQNPLHPISVGASLQSSTDNAEA